VHLINPWLFTHGQISIKIPNTKFPIPKINNLQHAAPTMEIQLKIIQHRIKQTKFLKFLLYLKCTIPNNLIPAR
jgi:hypothetical protein